MSKVFMINSGYSGCNYVRIMIPAHHNGFVTDKKSVYDMGKEADMEQVKGGLEWADVVVFHRPEKEEYHTLAKILKQKGKKIVADNDDTFHLGAYHPLGDFTPDGVKVEMAKRNESISRFMKECDLVTCSTKTLAKEYSEWNENVIILPNYVDPDDWDKPKKNDGDKVRIGLVGSVAYEFDYLHVKDVIRQLSKRDDVQIVLIGLGDKKHREANPEVTKKFKEEYEFWDSLEGLEWTPWCPVADYPRTLNNAKLDMMLIPRKDNYFNRCKSNIKFLEAAMCEIPVIAQSFEDGPYEEIKSGENGILIKDNADWMPQIESLINDKTKRRRMGISAKYYVLKNYDINNNYHKWADAYKTI
jgi:glycosyltransferase involved in cell wall biosynthesis